MIPERWVRFRCYVFLSEFILNAKGKALERFQRRVKPRAEYLVHCRCLIDVCSLG